MEVENQVSFIPPMLQKTQFGNVDDETTITFKEDADTPMTIDASAPGDVIELSDDFDFDGYQVVRREFFAHTFEPSITFNNYKVYVNTACLNKFPHADCAQLLINRESHILALRPCAESERDAFAWCNTSGGKRKPRQVTGKFFFAKLFELMDWNIDYRYKLIGKVLQHNPDKGQLRIFLTEHSLCTLFVILSADFLQVQFFHLLCVPKLITIRCHQHLQLISLILRLLCPLRLHVPCEYNI